MKAAATRARIRVNVYGNPVRDEKYIGDLVADQDSSKTEFFAILGNHAQDSIFTDRI